MNDARARELCERYGGSWDDGLTQDFYRALTGYDEFLGRRGPATGTRRLIKNRGGDIERCLFEMTAKKKPTKTFIELMEAGLVECTADYVVGKHRRRFPEAHSERVLSRLAEYGFRF